MPPSGWVGYSFSNESATGFDFNGVLRVTDLDRTGFNLGLSVDCRDATCGFEHTASIGLVLPEGVSYAPTQASS